MNGRKERCRGSVWKRWKHNLSHKDRTTKVNIGDIAMIKGESKNRGHWKIGTVSQLHTGKDEVVRAVKM